MTQHVVAGSISILLIELAKRLSFVPWFSRTSDALNRAASAVLAAASAAGISCNWDPAVGILSLSGLTIENLAEFAVNVVGQFFVQEGLYQYGKSRAAHKPGPRD